MTEDTTDSSDLIASLPGFYAQQRRETRDTTLVGGIVALVAMPLWTLFDRVMVPERAGTFLTVRLICEVAIALSCLALWSRRFGERWPEQISLLTVASIEIAIAWMAPRAGTQFEGYLLGLSLAFYATAFLLVWHWRMTLVLVACTAAAMAAFSIGVHPGLSRQRVTTIVFYLATSSALAITAQVYRDRKRWQQHVTQTALEGERRRNVVLMEELEQLSREDALTSVGNRRAWDERLTGEFLRARRSGRPLSILVFDLDHFKEVNDLRGHTVGDTVLRASAALLVDRVRQTDFVARLGGDEFAVLCPDTSLATAATLASDIRERTRTLERAGDALMTCSIGVAELERSDTSTESLYSRADAALYAAKTARDTVRCAEPGMFGDPRPGARERSRAMPRALRDGG
ncbi:MAG: hypothetical protein JWN46_3209 [Acidimicrobiales bacterium]|nr:hypothetical protein [Acidimicrobiales bacterium]